MAITDFLQEVDTKTENFRSNPRALAQAAQITEPTLEAVIARKVKKEKEAAFRDIAANVQIDPRKIAERDQQDIYAMTQDEAMQQADKLMARRQQSQDKKLRDFAANERGLASQNTTLRNMGGAISSNGSLMPLSRDVVRRNMGGGIAKFSTGVLVTDEQVEQLYQKLLKNPYRAQKATREEARSILEERAGKGLQPTAKNLIEGSVTARETPKGGLPALQKIPKSPVPTKFQGMTLTKEELEEKIKDVPQTGPGIMPPATPATPATPDPNAGLIVTKNPPTVNERIQTILDAGKNLQTMPEAERRTKSPEMEGISKALLDKTKVDPTAGKMKEEERVLDLLERDENKAALAGDIRNIEDFRRRQLDPEKIRDEELRAMLVGRSRSGIGGASMGLNLARRQQQEFEGNQLDNVFNKRKEAIASDIATAKIGLELGQKVYDTLIKDQTAAMGVLADIDANEIKDINERTKQMYNERKDNLDRSMTALGLELKQKTNEILAEQTDDALIKNMLDVYEEASDNIRATLITAFPEFQSVLNKVNSAREALKAKGIDSPTEKELDEELSKKEYKFGSDEREKYLSILSLKDRLEKKTNMFDEMEDILRDRLGS